MKVASNADHFVMLTFCVIQLESCSENDTLACVLETVETKMPSG